MSCPCCLGASQAQAAAGVQVRHKGQFALRRLYHESERLIVVLYTQPSCGPCRTLKPVLGKVRPVTSILFLEPVLAVVKPAEDCFGPLHPAQLRPCRPLQPLLGNGRELPFLLNHELTCY